MGQSHHPRLMAFWRLPVLGRREAGQLKPDAGSPAWAFRNLAQAVHFC